MKKSEFINISSYTIMSHYDFISFLFHNKIYLPFKFFYSKHSDNETLH